MVLLVKKVIAHVTHTVVPYVLADGCIYLCGCDRAIFAVPVTVNVCSFDVPCGIQLAQSYPSVLPSANSTVHFVPFHHRPTKPLMRRTTAPHDSCYISPMAASSFSSDAFLAAFMCLVLSWPSRKPTTTPTNHPTNTG